MRGTVLLLALVALAQATSPSRQLQGKSSGTRSFFKGADHGRGQKGPLEQCEVPARLAPDWTMLAVAEICAAPRDTGITEDLHHCGLVIQSRDKSTNKLEVLTFELGAERNFEFFTRNIKHLNGEYKQCKEDLLCQTAKAYNFLQCDLYQKPVLVEWKSLEDFNKWHQSLAACGTNWGAACAWNKADTAYKFSTDLKITQGSQVVDKIEDWFSKNWWYTDKKNCQSFSTELFHAIAKSDIKGREQEASLCASYAATKKKCKGVKQFQNLEEFKRGHPKCAGILDNGVPTLLQVDAVVPEIA